MIRLDLGDLRLCLLDAGRIRSHVPYPWIMGYDLEPLVTPATQKRVFPEAVREGWRICFGHDADLPLGILEEREGDRLRSRPVEVEA